MKKPLNYYGYAFDSSLSKNRRKKLKEQLKENGVDNSEVWNLDATIISFILPRLKLFRKVKIGYPGNLTIKKWNKLLDKMILAFQLSFEESEGLRILNTKERKQVAKGLTYI